MRKNGTKGEKGRDVFKELLLDIRFTYKLPRKHARQNSGLTTEMWLIMFTISNHFQAPFAIHDKKKLDWVWIDDPEDVGFGFRLTACRS